ncbi:MAG: cytochrome c [Verrucomicrobia bacterium]|nr:cytochrome c [Verrucomicrobiota bacterium]
MIDFIVSFQYEPTPYRWRRFWATLGLVFVFVVICAMVRFNRDRPVTYADPVEHFKYGSTGGERTSGIPLSLWKAIPTLFDGYLPGKGLQSLGFIFEDGKEFPVGTSRRNVQGIDRIFLNCAIYHVGTVRDTPESKPRIIVGMPANTIDLQAFQRFLSACAIDENFNAARLMDEIAKEKTEDRLNRLLLRLVGIDLMRQRLLTLRQRFSFMDREPDYGPGRVDTFNPPKVLLNFRMDNLPTNEWVGICDFPSVWNQRKRKGMHLHWDGNNDSVEERNRSASFGTGATPPTLDRASIKRMEDWLLDAAPPPFPYAIDRALAAKGESLYMEYCSRCHGRNGSDFTGELVGKITPIEQIKTDRHRLDSYSVDLCANQNLLYAAYPAERFKHFRKTFGYANQPLDGIWLRAPYLHSGSVPTLRDLLEPASQRPKVFYRGYDVYEPKRVGFVWNVVEEKGRKFFKIDTGLPGNGNAGHEGREYGTGLGRAEKDAIVEYMKTF